MTQTFQKRSVLTKETVRLAVYAVTLKLIKEIGISEPCLVSIDKLISNEFDKNVEKAQISLCHPTGSSPASFNFTARS